MSADTRSESAHRSGGIGALINAPQNSTRNIVFIAVALSVVCSVLVSGTAIFLRPLQLANATENRQRIILEVAGLYDAVTTGGELDSSELQRLFSQIEAHVVDLKTGKYVDTLNPATFDAQKASRDPSTSMAISEEDDIASITRRANHATVYLVRDDSGIRTLILPVYGYGLWSTMYGFIAFEGDANTIRGLRFYQQDETPGLGGEVDNPRWLAKWKGKLAFDDRGEPWIEVIRGNVDTTVTTAASDPRYQVDGLAGSTLTSRGVTNLLRYWLGKDGFGPYLKRLKRSGELQ